MNVFLYNNISLERGFFYGLHFLILGPMNVRHLTVILCVYASSGIAQQLGKGYDFEGNGKVASTLEQKEVYFHTTRQKFPDELMLTEAQYDLVRKLTTGNRAVTVEHLTFGTSQARQVSEQLYTGTNTNFRLFRLKGEDDLGNVHFTGYYTPSLVANREKTDEFRYPIYSAPIEKPLRTQTRRQIDTEGGLEGFGLEIAYTKSLLDNYILQVQGSGVLTFEDGSSTFLQFHGQNGKAYSSLGRYLVNTGQVDANNISLQAIRTYFNQNPDSLETLLNRNESYVFFKESRHGPRAAGVDLLPWTSIATDHRYIPPGSLLLAQVPKLDSDGVLTGHAWHLLVAHDRGGAIKGPGHVDLYTGIGAAAEVVAGQLHHYGRIWLILPEK